jgi:hypothetical protein
MFLPETLVERCQEASSIVVEHPNTRPDPSSVGMISGEPRNKTLAMWWLGWQRPDRRLQPGSEISQRGQTTTAGGGLRTVRGESPFHQKSQCDRKLVKRTRLCAACSGLSAGYADAGTKRLPMRPHTGLTATWLGPIQRLNLPRIAERTVSHRRDARLDVLFAAVPCECSNGSWGENAKFYVFARQADRQTGKEDRKSRVFSAVERVQQPQTAPQQ